MLTIVSLRQRNDLAVPLEINNCHVNIAVKNQVTRTKIDQVFTNPNPFPVDGIYIFPVADDAVVSNLALSIDGELVNGKLLSQEESERIYRNSARYGNRAILEHLGRRAFVVEVPGIPASGERRIQFEYSQIISADSDLTKYTYPLSLAKSASGPIRKLHVEMEMEIESENELRTVYSPSHEVTIDRKDDRHVHVSYEDTDADPDIDFLCYYSVSDDNFSITLLTHADEKEDGYFMLLVSPKYEVKKTEIIEKDFIFVLDRSGSMAGRKVEQAKAALSYCVQNLNDGDRFNLILFNTDIVSLADRLNRGEEWFGDEQWNDAAALSDKLIDVESGREKAFAFIEGIEGRGGTNINDALLTSLAEKPDPKRPRIIVFLTDGRPTAGVTNAAQILENVAKANKNLSRIFVFGVGYNLNDHLLNKMVADNGGTRTYVEPHEDIEAAVSSLFRKMNEPVLVDVGINFGQIITKELTPKNLPDLFREEQLTILGRYEGHGNTALKLRGIIGSEQYEFSKDVHFSALEPDNDFLPHLWAESRISELVDEATLSGGSRELFDEIERLSKKYGVQTPYTSFTLAEDGSLRRLYDSRISDAYTEATPISERIMYHRELEDKKYTRRVRQYADTKYIGRKTFYRHGKIWVDTEYDGQSERKKIEFGSEAYYELMNHLPELAKYSKIAKEALSMVICHEGVNYEITPPTV